MNAKGRPPSGTMRQVERVQVGGPGRGPMVAQKSIHFAASARRMLGRMRPDLIKVTGVGFLAVVSVTLFAVGPRVLGGATDLIVSGLLGRQ